MLVGLDIGGTKTHLQATDGDRVPVDSVAPSTGWSALPVDAAARWIVERLRRACGDATPDAVGVGAQACEEPAHCRELAARLQLLVGVPVRVVNDAELLVPAAGLERGVGLIVGTGAIAVATGPDGLEARAGGWGWVLSDEGSGSALVREAARAVLRRFDRGEPLDALGEGLLASVGVTSVPALVHALSWDGGVETWGRHSRAVVAAARAGSEDARRVVAEGADAAADLVAVIAARGVPVADVVLAGGVATNVPEVARGVVDRLAVVVPGARVRLLDVPPVAGAMELARRAAVGG